MFGRLESWLSQSTVTNPGQLMRAQLVVFVIVLRCGPLDTRICGDLKSCVSGTDFVKLLLTMLRLLSVFGIGVSALHPSLVQLRPSDMAAGDP